MLSVRERVEAIELAIIALGRMEFEYVEEQHPRDEKGQWTDSGGGGGAGASVDALKLAISGGKTSDALGSKGNPIKVSSASAAVNLIRQGKYVQMPPEQLSVALDKMAAAANEAKKTGQDFNLCLASIPDTNLFCAENQGVERIDMPQFSGKTVPGSEADGMPKNEKGEVDVASVFRDRLTAAGVTMTNESVPAEQLKATQNELVGTKVGGMMNAIEKGNTGIRDGRIFVSNDNYVLDGHHRWAAVVGEDYRDGHGGDINMNVTKVDMPISELLPYADNFTRQIGIAQKSGKHS